MTTGLRFRLARPEDARAIGVLARRVVRRWVLSGQSPEAAAPLLSVISRFKRHDVTEEVRVNSDFAGPLNVTAGGYLQRGAFSVTEYLGGNQTLPPPLNTLIFKPLFDRSTRNVETKTNSIFGQLRWKIIPQVELDEKLQQVIIDQAAASFGKTPIPQMERKRDDSQLAILHALAEVNAQQGGGS